MEELCKVVSKRANMIEFRPPVHDKLHNEDEMFDLKFDACLRCQQTAESVYNGIIRQKNQPLIDNLSQSYVFATTTCDQSYKFITVSCVNTCLSDADRVYLINDIERQLEASHETIFGRYRGTSCNSAFDFFAAVSDDFRVKAENKLSRNMESQAQFSEDPLKVLVQLYLDYCTSYWSSLDLEKLSHMINTGTQVLTIIVDHVECMNNLMFEQIIRKLYEIDTPINLIIFNSSHCALPLRLDAKVQGMIQFSVYESIMPMDLYDQFMRLFLVSKSSLVSFPPVIIAWLHESFWRSSCCVQSTIYRIGMCLSIHFMKRTSLLCMFQELDWQFEMKLIKKKPAVFQEDIAQLDAYKKSIAVLMDLLDVKDVQGTGLRLSAGTDDANTAIAIAAATATATVAASAKQSKQKSEKRKMQQDVPVLVPVPLSSREAEYQFASAAIFASLERSRLDHALFQCLMLGRDHFLDLQQRREFSSDIVFAALLSEHVMAEHIKKRADNCAGVVDQSWNSDMSLHTSGDLVEELILCFEKSFRKISFERVSSVVSKWLVYMRQAMADGVADATLPTLLSNLADLVDLFQDAIDNAEMYRPTSNCVDSAQGADDIRFDINVIRTHLLSDTISWLRECTAYFQHELDRPNTLPGALEISSEAFQTARQNCSGCIRLESLTALVHPHLYITNGAVKVNRPSDLKIIPDICIVTDSILDVQKEIALAEVFEHFQSNCNDWPSKPLNKQANPPSKSDDSEDAHVAKKRSLQQKCRFAVAIGDLSATGVIRVRHGVTAANRDSGAVVVRQEFSWIGRNNLQ